MRQLYGSVFSGKVLNWISNEALPQWDILSICHQQWIDTASAVNSLQNSQTGWRECKHANTHTSKKQIHPCRWRDGCTAHSHGSMQVRGKHTKGIQFSTAFYWVWWSRVNQKQGNLAMGADAKVSKHYVKLDRIFLNFWYNWQNDDILATTVYFINKWTKECHFT